MKSVTITLFASMLIACAEDWPTYRANNRRSGTTEETLPFPLKQHWLHQGGFPQQAWSGPAKWDAYSANSGLQSMRNFDPCHYTVTYAGKVYYGSSADNAVHCLDLKSGKEEWVHFSNGAVRLPPALTNGKAYFGSDDGFAYCIDANTGKLQWKVAGWSKQRTIISNGKFLSTHPIRTGVTLVGDKAVFGASLLPWNSSRLVALNQKDGQQAFNTESRGHTLQGSLLHGDGILYVPQGRMAPIKFNAKTGAYIGPIGAAGGITCLLTEDNQFIAGPQNQRQKDEQMRLIDAKGRHITTFNNANRVTVYKDFAFIHTDGKLKCVDRSALAKIKSQTLSLKAKLNSASKGPKASLKKINSRLKKTEADLKAIVAQLAKLKPNKTQKTDPDSESSDKQQTVDDQLETLKSRQEKLTASKKSLTTEKKEIEKTLKNIVSPIETKLKTLNQETTAAWRWETAAVAPSDLIVAGDHLITGHLNKVTAYSRKDGKEVWAAKVDGLPHGLTASNGTLLVSTNKGTIYAFTK